MARTIHVISPVAGFGNRLDLEIAASILERNGFDVTRHPVIDRRKVARYSKVARRLASFRGRFDVNLFLAPIFPEWLPLARKNLLIPNAEGFAPHLHKWLPRIDLVLAKTRLTEKVFGDLGCKTEFVSFTSKDHLNDTIPRDYTRFFHSCSSEFKGTKRLLEVWKEHPEWPDLVTVINHNSKIPMTLEAPNIRVIRKALTDSEVVKFQNMIGFHICCSEAEGYGHYIMEAMSCRAVTFTTNAPPMNELVQPDRGLLVDCLEESEPMGLSRRYFFSAASLEAQVNRAIDFDPPTIERLGVAARDFFVANDEAFQRRFVDLMRAL